MDQVERTLTLGDRVRAIVEGRRRQLDAKLPAIDDIGDTPRTRLGRGRALGGRLIGRRFDFEHAVYLALFDAAQQTARERPRNADYPNDW